MKPKASPLPVPEVGDTAMLRGERGLPIRRHVISLGAGVQSSAMALMFACGDLNPAPDCAIFADTGAEPMAVYEYLDYLERILPFPVIRTMHKQGLLAELINGPKSREKGYAKSNPPFFAKESNAALRRQCTEDYKILPIRREIRKLIGAKRSSRATIYIGISLDEAHRMKPSRVGFIEHRWPLIDLRMSRGDCLTWMETRGFRRPPRSACTFCPYHSDAEWLRLREQDPDGWQQAVEVDAMIRTGWAKTIRETLYLHRSHQPLPLVQLSADEKPQLSMFGNECEGMCGV